MTDFQRGPAVPGQQPPANGAAWDGGNLDQSVEPPFTLPEDDLLDALEVNEVVNEVDTVDSHAENVEQAVAYTGARTEAHSAEKVADPVNDRYVDYDRDHDAPVAPPAQTRRKRPQRYEDDHYASTPVPQQRLAPRTGYGCADVITAIFLLMTVAVCGYTSLLLANPTSPLNPLPPPPTIFVKVLATALPTNTPTDTYTPLPATNTPPATSTPTPSSTPTITPTATATQTPVVGSVVQPTVAPPIDATQPQDTVQSTPQSTAAGTLPLDVTSPFTPSPFPFTVEPIQYVAHKGQDACSWQSIAGTVVDMSGQPIKGLALHVAGGNGNVDEYHYTGTEPSYGDGGFEVFLGAIPREDQYTVQLLGRTGEPISDIVTVLTHTACDENVVFIQFVQNHGY